ncbi:hypothetical protein EJ06DRAFT_469515 [Trichodelitschia bisporula]|uniref:DUF803-domain-containing protein n=1 Tax=Trichodelitschia bisporula TaxID=703511 RepID=A0A6G1I7C4_9PEZI|nr:hypothetical protein EJ06DRAFT_469515 [Trichodelitschia bisporula]
MPDLSAGASVAIGVLVGLISTCVQSIGLTLQRKSHLLEEQKEEHHGRRPPYRRRRWQLGMLMFLVSNIVGSTIQITTLPLPVLSTLQASGLVFNTACATIILDEPFTRWSIIGTALVATGAVLIGTFGALTEPSHNLTQLLFLLGRHQFLLWLFGTFFIIIVILVGQWFLERAYHHNTHRLRLIRGMSFGCISGILSAHCLLIAKSAVELVVRTIVDHVNQFNRWQSWMILVGLVFFALTQLYYLHCGLRLVSTSVLYPFVFCIYNIVAILDGLIYFQQASRLSAVHAALIAVGTVILLGGVFALSWRLEPEHAPGAPAAGAKARIPTPQTALTPGMGLLNTEGGEESAPPSPYLRPADDEEAITHAHSLRPSENTPLLRTTTAPMYSQRPGKKKGALRPTKPRRLTLTNETSEIWDELHDRGDRRLSGSWSTHSGSPGASRTVRFGPGARRGGTLPARRPGTRLRWPSMDNWAPWEAGRSRPARPLAEEEHEHDDETTDGEPEGRGLVVPRTRGRGWSLGRRGEDQGEEGGWFKLKWWKRRRRSGEGEGA